jgi:hypothetical protein
MMTTYPYTIENGAGERITFTGIVRDPDGDRVVGEALAQPKAGPPMHIHYMEAEGFTVTSGRLGYQVRGEEPRYAGSGEAVVFPAGTVSHGNGQSRYSEGGSADHLSNRRVHRNVASGQGSARRQR